MAGRCNVYICFNNKPYLQMKYILLLLLCIASFSLKAQDDTVYVFNQSTVINRFDPKIPSKLDGNVEVAQKNWKFVVDHDNATGHIIRFLEWEGSDTSARNEGFHQEVVSVSKTSFWSKQPRTVEEPGDAVFFYITKAVFDKVVEEAPRKEPKRSFVTGALTIPVKMRPGGSATDDEGNKIRPFDFSGEVNVGLTIGLRMKVKGTNDKVFVIPSVGLNLTSVSIDESTVRNGLITSKTNASSVTPFTGLILEYDGFQLALMTGWDHLAGRTGENWIYQGKPWYGLGIGYNIFNTKAGKPKNNSEE